MKYAFVGTMHSGKSTAAQYLVEKHQFTRIALADPVKNIAVNTLNDLLSRDPHKKHEMITYDKLNKMKNDPHIRHLLQFIGTELGREWTGNDAFWIKYFLECVRVEEFYVENDGDGEVRIVNDDCRFKNEAYALRENGFTLVRVERDENERYLSLRNAIWNSDPTLTELEIHDRIVKMMDHPSEKEMQEIQADITIFNNGMFYENLRRLV